MKFNKFENAIKILDYKIKDVIKYIYYETCLKPHTMQSNFSNQIIETWSISKTVY